MIDLTQDIYSLSDFQRNSRDHIKRLKKTGRPAVLTHNGKPSVVIQDAASYQDTIKDLEELATIRAIHEGIKAMESGKTRPFSEFMKDMQKKHGVPPLP